MGRVASSGSYISYVLFPVCPWTVLRAVYTTVSQVLWTANIAVDALAQVLPVMKMALQSPRSLCSGCQALVGVEQSFQPVLYRFS